MNNEKKRLNVQRGRTEKGQNINKLHGILFRMKLKNTDKLEIVDRKLKVNGKTFTVQHPDEPLFCINDGKLETIVFKACGYTCTEWEPEEIEGYFSE